MGDTEYYAALLAAENAARLAARAEAGEIEVTDLHPNAVRPYAWYLNGSPTGMFRSNIDRSDVPSDTAAITSGTMLSVPVLLFAGDVVTNLTFASGATAAGTPTHWFFALYDTAATPALIGQSADQTTTAWAANTSKTLALAAPYTVRATGWYRASVSVTASTVPTLSGITVMTAASAGVVTGQIVLAQTSGSALGATAPATIASPTTATQVPYVVAT